MSENEAKSPAPPPAAPKKGGGAGIVAVILPALLAGGGAFGGAKFSAHGAAAPAAEHAAAPVPPPGPTLALEPFLVVTQDATKKPHALKVTLAVEFESSGKEESFKEFTPRVRDACLTYIRLVSYEDAVDSSKTDKMRTDLLDRLHAAGVTAAQRVLVTDLVVQ
jgi:flagellar protein FliL